MGFIRHFLIIKGKFNILPREISSSLPYRQLRKHSKPAKTHRQSSLPYRQLRNLRGRRRRGQFCSLPYRQLRNTQSHADCPRIRESL